MSHRASAKSIDPSALLELLPLPCLFASLHRKVIFANVAARRLLPWLAQGGGNEPNLLDGASILDDELLLTFGLPTTSDLELYLQDLQDRQQRMEQAALTLPVTNRESSVAIPVWTLACSQIDGESYFSFIAAPTPTDPATPVYAEQSSSEEEDWRMLQTITAPTFNSPSIVCSIMTASQASYKLNDCGHQYFSITDSDPWNSQQIRNLGCSALMDAKLAPQLPLEEGVAATSLLRSQSLFYCRSFIADLKSGGRFVCKARSVLVSKPHNRELLGVIVCIEPEEFSLYLQRYDDMRIATLPTASKTAWNRARLIRSITLGSDVDFLSATWTSYTGLESTALRGQSWFDCVHPEDRTKFHQMEPLNPAVAQSRECEVRLRGRDGLYRWFSDRTEPLQNEEGRLVRWYSISEDVHDLVMKREQANTDKFLLEKLIADLEIVFFTLDQTYTVSSASGTMKFDNLMSDDTYSAQSLIGLNLLEFINSISPGGIPELQRCLMDVMNGTSPKEIVEYAFGPRYIRTILVPQVNEDHETHSKDWIQGVIGTSIDITAARVHDDVKAQMKAMEETNRLKSEFLANVSHEVRTPIAGMMGLVELLFETELSSQQVEYLECIQSSASTLIQIVNDILDFSKAEASAIVPESLPFSLSRFVDDVCKRNRVLAAKKGLQFLYSSLESDIQLLGDSGRIRQILDNLITNAVKFTHQGFVRLSISFQTSDEMVCVTFLIEDSGIGIEKKDLDKLFFPFAQVDQSTTRIYGGSGLGLSIARKMAEIMGGSVTLESNKGTGTKAKLTLQLAPAPSYPETLGKTPVPLLQPDTGLEEDKVISSTTPKLSLEQRSALHILFVEDNEINRKVVLAHLSHLGFKRIHAARNGAEALEYVSTVSSNNTASVLGKHSTAPDLQSLSKLEKEEDILSWPDIIIMDCQMPIMDGYEATRRLRSQLHYDRPIIALTASAIEGDRERCLVSGMDDHIAKPASRKQLSEIIDKWALNPVSTFAVLPQHIKDVSTQG